MTAGGGHCFEGSAGVTQTCCLVFDDAERFRMNSMAGVFSVIKEQKREILLFARQGGTGKMAGRVGHWLRQCLREIRPASPGGRLGFRCQQEMRPAMRMRPAVK